MFSALYCIIPIFLLVATGYVVKSKFIASADFWKGSEKITYYILFPALLINSLVPVDLHKNMYNVLVPLILATLALGLFLLILQKIIRIDKARFTSYFQGSIRYNSYIFIGVATAFYGASALPVVAIIIAYMIIITNIFSVIVLSLYTSDKRPDLLTTTKNIIKNPLVLACLIGVALNKVPFLYPHTLGIFFDFLGAAALPLSLMCVGAGLQFAHLFKHYKPILLVNAAKLVVLPIVSLIFLNLFHVPIGMIKGIALLYAAAPCAGNAYILAIQMKGDAETMAAIISTTTLASIITIPFIISFL